MPEQPNPSAWLVQNSGPLAGKRHLLRGPVTRVGRAPDNDIVIDEAAIVSAHHLEIRKEGSAYRVYDRNSTNGTYLNGKRVREAPLEARCAIRLGADGPELTFLLEAAQAAGAGGTVLAVPKQPGGEARGSITDSHERLLSSAVARARMARGTGAGNQTVVLMREVLHAALHRSTRKLKIVIGALVIALVAISAYGTWRIEDLKSEKKNIDRQIQDIETLLKRAGENPAEAERLIARLDRFQDRARAMENSLFYRVGIREEADLIEREIRALMDEFGAEIYSIPPEFREQVDRFIRHYQGSDRPHMARALGAARGELGKMRAIFRQENLPPDLAYMALVESALDGESASSAGAAGLWQFTPYTARAYGLRVTRERDERLDPEKATRAACRYIRELILDFGAGSSVMLALAAYNFGPTRVKQAIRKVSDPIKQRNFWYLYRVRALPEETREYVPKVTAVMIIARNPERFGF